MNVRPPCRRLLAVTLFCGLALTSSSCRQDATEAAKEAAPLPVIIPELETNGLGDMGGAVYRSQADSPIHWQPWTQATFERAKAARRLLFCVIAVPQQPVFLTTLAELSADPATVAAINDQYVPVLIDGDASRELGLLSAELCAEIRRPLQLPLFVWMTHERNPVTWIPASPSPPGGVVGVFKQSHMVVSQMWEDDAQDDSAEGARGYMLENSAADNAARRSRYELRSKSVVMSEQPAVDVVHSLRQLVSLYDPYSRNFDEAGGLFPASSLELLATAAVRPGLPPEFRERCIETTRDLLTGLLPSAMFDPLDGGVYSARRGMSWAFPSFVRNCPDQGRVAVTLIAAYRATGETEALDKALGLISFAEKSYQTPDGLFAVGLNTEPDASDWMWSVEEVEKVLGPEDAAWWIKATRMKGLGNLPMEADPRREYFRQNSIGLSRSMERIAADLSLPVESFEPRFESAKAKLLEVRNRRVDALPRDESPHVGACFRMVSAYASAYGATGDESYREKAVELLERAREAFTQGPFLRLFSGGSPDSIGAGRAFHYALALQSALDVAAITSDERWLNWAEDLASTAAELFTGDGYIKECPDGAKLLDLPITDRVMLFDDSTVGVLSLAECRFAELNRPMVASFRKLVTPLPTSAIDRPILHADLLQATLIRHYRLTVILGEELSDSLRTAVARLPLRTVQRRAAHAEDEVPAGSIKVVLPQGRSSVVTTPEALQEALLPSPGK